LRDRLSNRAMADAPNLLVLWTDEQATRSLG
jgi:hypothetical protein